MRTIDLGSFLGSIEQRKAAIGFDESPVAVEARRNRGTRRTPAKREALQLAEARAVQAGRAPVLSYR
jgi:hypothetical protein